MTKKESALKTLKENLCGMCAYGSQCMESCDIRGCDNRDAIKVLSAEPCKDGTWSLKGVTDALKRHGLLQEQEPCDDNCISRLDTLMVMKIMMDNATIGDGDNDYATLDDLKEQYIEIVKGMAPVTSQRWIPVSEKLPEDGTWNLFTDGKKVSVERYKLDAMDHFYPNGRWFSLEEVVAWMPLPERYKVESENPE